MEDLKNSMIIYYLSKILILEEVQEVSTIK
jgi:hypothetical protein